MKLKDIQRSNHAFTVIELVIAITVIGILVTLTTLAILTVQRDARDSQRSSAATALAEALEKYYEEHGEYPSCEALSTNPLATLPGIDPKTLTMPSNNIDSSIACHEITSSETGDVLAFVGDDSTGCVNNNVCLSWKLSYKQEKNGEIVTVESRRTARDVLPNVASEPTGNVSVSANMIGGIARGTASGGVCATNTTLEYQIRSTENDDDWSSYITGGQRDVTSTSEGHRYGFQARARCVGPTNESGWVDSLAATVIRPVTAPSGLTITASMSGTNARGTTGGGSCASGTTLERQIRYQQTSPSSTGQWSEWIATTQYHDLAADQGYRYTFQQQAKCVGLHADSPYTESVAAAVIRPIDPPATPAGSVSTSGNTTTYTRGDVSCTAGTTVRYGYRYLADWGYDTGWLGPSMLSSISWTTQSQGYNYRIQWRAQCYTPYTESAWSGTRELSYVRPIDGPGGVSGWSLSIPSNRRSWTITWNHPTCGPGTTPTFRYNMLVGSPMYWEANGRTGWFWNPWHGEPAYYTTSLTSNFVGSGAMPGGAELRVKVQYRCQNFGTGRVGPYGGEQLSPSYRS